MSDRNTASDIREAAKSLLDAKAFEMAATGMPLDRYGSNWMRGALIWLASPQNEAATAAAVKEGEA